MTEWYEYYAMTSDEEKIVNAPVEEEITIDNSEFPQFDDSELDTLVNDLQKHSWDDINTFLEKLAENNLNPNNLVYSDTNMDLIKKARRKQVIEARFSHTKNNVFNQRPWDNTWVPTKQSRNNKIWDHNTNQWIELNSDDDTNGFWDHDAALA